MMNERLKLVEAEKMKARGFEMPESLRQLRDHAKVVLDQRLAEVFDHVDDTFFDLADRAASNGEQATYFDAMRLIRLQRKSIEHKFSQAIDNSFQRLGNRGYRGASTRASAAESPAGLTLVENEDLEEMIAMDSMVSKVAKRHKYDLKLLVMRINSIVPSEVTAINNPLGPDIICESLRQTLLELEIDIRSKLVLLKLIDRHVMDAVGTLLVDGNRLLRKFGVLPDLEKQQAKKAINPNQSAQGSGAAKKPDYQEGNSAFAKHGAERSGGHSQLISQLQEFLGQPDNYAYASAPNASISQDQLVSLVSGLQREWGESSHSEGGLLGLIEGRLQQQGGPGLGRQDYSVVSLLDQLFSRMHSENHISGGFSRELRKLELPLLRIVLQDPSFFDKEKHPARRLINEITQVAIGFPEDADINTDPVGRAISEIAQKLSAEETMGTEDLKQLLLDFIQLTEKERRKALMMEQRVIEKAAASEKVNQAHQLVDKTLNERMQGKSFPRLLVHFAEKAWCRVMFMACLRTESSPEQWETAVGILDRVLAHADGGEVSDDDVKSLLAAIQEHLEDIAYESYDLGRLIIRLEEYFYRNKSENDKPDEGVGQIEPVAEELTGQPEEVAGPKVQTIVVANKPHETVVIRKIKTDMPGQRKLEEDAATEGDEAAGPDEASLKALNSLCRGAWVDFLDETSSNKRCKVAGVISPPGIYIFVNRQGTKVAEMNRNRTAISIQNKNLVVLDNSHLFDNTLERVIKDIRTSRQAH